MKFIPRLVVCLSVVAGYCLFSSGVVAQERGFHVPDASNTYVVTHDVRGLECVKGVGGPKQCAVTNQSADEGGYPWTEVKCRPGDMTVDRFAWSLDRNEPIGIFEAPPALVSQAKLYTVNVRLGRTCMKSGKR